MKHIYESDIAFFETERQKIKTIFDSLDNKIAKTADKAIDEMLNEFFLDTNISMYFVDGNLRIVVTNGDDGKYEADASLSEVVEPLITNERIFSAAECGQIADAFQSIAQRFATLAKSKQ